MLLLDRIVQASKLRLEARKRKVSLSDLQKAGADAPRATTGFREALEAKPFVLIAEVKVFSPSSGAMDATNVQGALEAYDACSSIGVISIVTDEDFFLGSLDRLSAARAKTSKPLLRKDFIIDEYQIWEARAHGADAVLLMGDLFERPSHATALVELAHALGMQVLLELGTSGYIPSGVSVVGINARRFDMASGAVVSSGLHRTERLRIPTDKLAVAESGIRWPSDLSELVQLGYRAALIGTAFLAPGVRVDSMVTRFDSELRRQALR